jgi:glycosyltransferase involved in cell wall biosynthesis
MGAAVYAVSFVIVSIASIIAGRVMMVGVAGWALWLAGAPVWAGIALAATDLLLLLPGKRTRDKVQFTPLNGASVTVVLTAFNDEASIGLAVADFLSHPRVADVLVIDNNSSDRTRGAAAERGARVISEEQPGYGRCVFLALREGLATGADLTLLCEGDMTFRAYDIDKFLAYAPHADIVNGTRIVEQLRARNTQLTTFMYYGNFFMGKLLETKHAGQGTFTDVGTTYKLCRSQSLAELLPLLDPAVNLEFNAHFMDTALTYGFSMVECPVTFHPRVGESKGGNVNNFRALKVGVKMLIGIAAGWRFVRERPL